MGDCDKCDRPASEHGTASGRCRGHSKVRDADDRWTGEWKPCAKFPVLGAGVCLFHGAGNPAVRAAAARRALRSREAARLRRRGLYVELGDDEVMLEHARSLAASVIELDRSVREQGGRPGRVARLALVMLDETAKELEAWLELCIEAGMPARDLRRVGQLVESRRAASLANAPLTPA